MMLRIPLLALALLASMTCQAAIFCAGTSSELKQAMSTAGSNNEDDEIRIETGTYPSPELTPFIYNSDANFDVEISGGWSSGTSSIPCSVNSAIPDQTSLDGENEKLVMIIQGESGDSGQITIRNLAILKAGGINATGLKVSSLTSGFSGEIIIDRVNFRGNQGSSGSALNIVGGNKVTVRNCVFAFNATQNGQGVAYASMSSLDQGVYFVNNTFTFGFHEVDPPTSTTTSGLYVNLNDDGTNQSRAFVANNLFWANETNDIWLAPVGTTYVHNNNFFFPYTGGDFNSGNLSLDPQLVQIGVDFRPAAGSPLIDQGLAEPTPPIPVPTPFHLDWSHGHSDFYGGFVPTRIATRIRGEGVDIGAAESPFKPDDLFRDRFEQ